MVGLRPEAVWNQGESVFDANPRSKAQTSAIVGGTETGEAAVIQSQIQFTKQSNE
jgi:hypothetical protein